MGRLFDAGTEEKQQEVTQARRDEARRRAEEIDKVFREEGYLDDKADKLGQQLAAAAKGTPAAVEAIRYLKHRTPGSRWSIEHAQVGEDYVFQLFPLRPIAMKWEDVITALIIVMDAIYPRSVQIKYTPPDQLYQVAFYTVRLTDVTRVPGWKVALERTLAGMAAVNAWS